MAPYPQGVYVDAEGTVRSCETFASTSAVDDLKLLLGTPDAPLRLRSTDQPLAWRKPSAMRCVSLRRLIDEWTQLQTQRDVDSRIDDAHGRSVARPIPIHGRR